MSSTRSQSEGPHHAGDTAARATLAVAITTRDSADRLQAVIDHARGFADEVLVGVDDGSTDATLDVALAHGDLVYRFHHTGENSPSRSLPHRMTACDWVLELDDDERMDAAFPAVVPELLAATEHTHWWLPRKWIAETGPLQHVGTAPWFPDWQLRLVRTDPCLIWKPIGVHTGRRVVGRAGHDPRASILHFERVERSDEYRAEKLRLYRGRGGIPASEVQYGTLPARREPVDPGPAPAAAPRAPGHRARLVPGSVDLDDLPRLPLWNADITVEQFPDSAPAEGTVIARISAKNTGGLHWTTHHHSPTEWPILNLVCREVDEQGVAQDATAQRFGMPKDTPVGAVARFLVEFRVPEGAGIRTFHWELVSENEAWFSSCGPAQPAVSTLHVTEAVPAGAARPPS